MSAITEFIKFFFTLRFQIIFLIAIGWLPEALRKSYQTRYLQAAQEVQDEGDGHLRRNSVLCEPIDPVDLDKAPMNLPRVHWLWKFYCRASTSFMVYVITREALGKNIIISYIPASRCYMLGRLTLVDPVSGYYSLLFSFLHLGWRLTQTYLTEPPRLDLLAMMMQDAHVTESYCKTNPPNPTNFDRYIKSLMYYPVKYRAEVFYRLRPNRTSEARLRVERALKKGLYAFYITMTTAVIIVFSRMFYLVLSHHEYTKAHPRCSDELGMFTIESLGFSFSQHRLVTIIIEVAENVFIWIDSGLSIFFLINLVHILTVDLLIYIESIRKGLESQLCLCRSSPATAKESWSDKLQLSRREYLFTFEHHADPAVELQAMMRDMFDQIRDVNSFVSKFNNTGMAVWLGNFSLFTFTTLVSPNKSESLVWLSNERILLSLMLAVAIIICLCVVPLYTNSKRLHLLICSLMAHDKSPQKSRYTAILDYYMYDNGASYTYFYNYKATPGVIIVMVSWSISCAIIVESFYRSLRVEK